MKGFDCPFSGADERCGDILWWCTLHSLHSPSAWLDILLVLLLARPLLLLLLAPIVISLCACRIAQIFAITMNTNANTRGSNRRISFEWGALPFVCEWVSMLFMQPHFYTWPLFAVISLRVSVWGACYVWVVVFTILNMCIGKVLWEFAVFNDK